MIPGSRALKTLGGAALLLLAAGCTATPPDKAAGMPVSPFLSLTPASLGRSLSRSQMVTGAYDGRVYKMRFEVEITPERLVIAGLSPLGVTLFTVVQDQGGSISVDRLEGQMPFDPRHILSDVYLTYWPAPVLRAALAPLSMRLETGDGTVRRLHGSDGRVIAEIDFAPGNQDNGGIVVRHFDFPYGLRIVPLDPGKAQ